MAGRRAGTQSHRVVIRCYDCGHVAYFGATDFPHINEISGALSKHGWTNAEAPIHTLAHERGLGTVWICQACSKKWAERTDLKLAPRWKPGDP